MRGRELELSGSDCFLRAMDRLARGKGASLCRLVVELDGALDLETCREFLNESAVLRWAANVTVHRPLLLALPRWRLNGTEQPVPVIPEALRVASGGHFHFHPADGRQRPQGPLSFSLVRHSDSRTSCILNWDHVLMDARGAETLVRSLADGPAGDAGLEKMFHSSPQVVERGAAQGGVGSRFAYARKSISYIAGVSGLPIAGLGTGREASSGRYRVITFSRAETDRIRRRCEGLGAGCYHSLVFLAAATRGIHAVRMRRGEKNAHYLVPVPLSLRKIGGTEPVFSNHVSFLFYRMEPGELDDLPGLVTGLKKRLREQVAGEIPHSYAEMMRFLRRLPQPLYTRLVAGPTQGRLASFFFSCPGECCPGVDRFLGLPVRDITHLAPVSGVPGLSVVFMFHDGRLKTILSMRQDLLSGEETTLFETLLRRDLLE
ncbi:MAG: hypothetical protein Kow0089_05400 [Desulfobulbaceae bacterium]